MGELLDHQIEGYLAFGRAVAEGLPAYLDDIQLRHIMRPGIEHMLTLMRDGLNGKAHGDQSADAAKYFVPNDATVRQIPYLIDSGLWTPDAQISYPSPDDVDDSRALGEFIPGLASEAIILGEGEESAHTVVFVDATIDGAVRRAKTMAEVLAAGADPDRLVVLSGLRRVREIEGGSGRFADYTPDARLPRVDVPEDAPAVVQRFPTNYHATNAIMQKEFPGLTLRSVREDDGPDAHQRGHESARVYDYTNPHTQKEVEVIVMNGMPVVQANATNRSTELAEPSAPKTFAEYLDVFGTKPGDISYISSYPHRNRIALEGLMVLMDKGLADDVHLHPQGKMSWADKVTAGLMAGEVEPMTRLTRRLLDKAGLPQDRLPHLGPLVLQYLQGKK